MAPPRARRCSSPSPWCGASRRWAIRRRPRRRAQARCTAGPADADHVYFLSICRGPERLWGMARRNLGLDGFPLGCGIEELAREGVEARARTSAPDALQVDARALHQQEELVGEAFGPCIARLAHEAGEALAL